MKKRRKRRGHSGAGRPRKEGARFTCGKLKPPSPNPVVVDFRRVLLGDPDAKGQALKHAENPLDLALHRGWLDEASHRAALDYAELHRQAGVQLPALRVFDPDRVSRSFDASLGDPVAMARLRVIWNRLRPAPQVIQSLVDVCLLHRWPEWVQHRVAGLVDDEGRCVPEVEITRTRLVTGLSIVARVIRFQPPAAPLAA